MAGYRPGGLAMAKGLGVEARGVGTSLLQRGVRAPPRFVREQASVIRRRATWLARFAAIATLLWIPFDVVRGDGVELAVVVALRVVLAAALVSLVVAIPRLPTRLVIPLLLGIQAAVFAAMQIVQPPADGFVRSAYDLMPVLIAGQLAFFPVPWLHNLAHGLPAVALAAVPTVLGYPQEASFLNACLLLACQLGAGAWIGHLQLELFVTMLGTQQDATHDALTGLANRRSADARLVIEHARAQRDPRPLSVALVDLDHFKRVNDEWGHAAGDRVLAATAQALAATARTSDLPARFGGEEFLVVLPATDENEALVVAERMRAAVEAMRVELGATTIAVTASVGVSTLQRGESIERLIERADQALYRAKADGRNCCRVASAQLEHA